MADSKTPMDEIITILNSHEPFDEKELHDIEFIRKLMRENDNLLSRECQNGHFTGSALVVDLQNRKFLLHFHKKLNRWLQFGGHPEFETNPADVALRESVEETGLTDLRFFPFSSSVSPIDIDVHMIPEHKGDPEHPHLDFRYILVTENPESVFAEKEDESSTFQWFDFDFELDQKIAIDPALSRLILKAKRLLDGDQN